MPDRMAPVFVRWEVRRPPQSEQLILHISDGAGNTGDGQCHINHQRICSGTAQTWQALLDRYAQGELGRDLLLRFGQDLYQVLVVQAGLGPAWGNIRAAHGRQPWSLILDLATSTEAFAGLPLELLHDGQDFVFAQPGSGLERWLNELPSQPFLTPDPLRVLFAWACPTGTQNFDPAPHRAALQRCFPGQVTELRGASLDDIRAEIRQNSYAFLHLMAHGARQASAATGCLVLDDGQGGLDPVEPQRLAQALEQSDLRLAFLCSCQSAIAGGNSFSGLGQRLLASGRIGCVVAMQAALPVACSADLAEGFYKHLKTEGDPSLALHQARQAAYGSGSGAWSIPVLLRRPLPEARQAHRVPAEGLPGTVSTYQPRAELAEALTRLRQHRLLALVGLPGIGKTELGKALAMAARDQGLVHSVLYQDVEPGSTWAGIRSRLGFRLGAVQNLLDDAELADLARQRQGSWLVLMDNAEELMQKAETESIFADGLSALLSAPGVRVVLTTRWLFDATGWSERPVELEIPPMSPTQAEALLKEELQQQKVLDPAWLEQPAWKQILELCDGHPRTIALISSHFKESSPARVLARLQQHRAQAVVSSNLFGRQDKFAVLQDGKKARLKSLAAGLDFSFTVLMERYPQVEPLFYALSLFPAGWPDRVAWAAAGGPASTGPQPLLDYHLVAWRQGRWFQPVPVQWYAQDRCHRTQCDLAQPLGLALPALTAEMLDMNQRLTTGDIPGGCEQLTVELPNLQNWRKWLPLISKDAQAGFSALAPALANGLQLMEQRDLLRACVDQGLDIARYHQDRLGEANCLQSLGDLA